MSTTVLTFQAFLILLITTSSFAADRIYTLKKLVAVDSGHIPRKCSWTSESPSMKLQNDFPGYQFRWRILESESTDVRGVASFSWFRKDAVGLIVEFEAVLNAKLVCQEEIESIAFQASDEPLNPGREIGIFAKDGDKWVLVPKDALEPGRYLVRGRLQLGQARRFSVITQEKPIQKVFANASPKATTDVTLRLATPPTSGQLHEGDRITTDIQVSKQQLYDAFNAAKGVTTEDSHFSRDEIFRIRDELSLPIGYGTYDFVPLKVPEITIETATSETILDIIHSTTRKWYQ